mmetsp:Transcript_38471/g.64724  ORF Transcript_38471/g.64724 Transcript_38471/m.64724 type:complete len:224 (-) Transcript_38471:2002-2673(-)
MHEHGLHLEQRHLEQRRVHLPHVSFQYHSQEGGHAVQHQCVQSVEDPLLPEVVVLLQLRRAPCVSARHRLLDLAQQRRDGAVFPEELLSGLHAVALDHLVELVQVLNLHHVAPRHALVHHGGGGGDGLHHQVDDGAVLLHLVHQRVELPDRLVGHGHKVGDAEGVPVERAEARVEHLLELDEALGQQRLLHGGERGDGVVVVLQHGAQPLHVPVVLLLLQGDV